jgi:Domain of unknown function (DUF4132)
MPVRRALRRLSPAVREHERRAGTFVDAIEHEFAPAFSGATLTLPAQTRLVPWDPIDKLESGRELLAQPPDVLVSAAVVAAARAESRTDLPWSTHQRVLAALARRQLPYTEADARQLLGFAHGAYGLTRAELLKTALSAVETVGPERFADDLRRELETVDDLTGMLPAGDVKRLRARMLSLLPANAFRLTADDNWAKRIAPRLRDDVAAAPLLQHLATATQSKPTKKWKQRAAELLDGREDLMHELLEAAAEVEPRVLRTFQWEGRTYTDYLYLADANATIVKGAVWAAGVLDADWSAALIGAIFPRAYQHNEAVANACILVLGELADEQAVRELATLQASIKHRAFQKRIVSALESAAARAGLSASQLLERMVPDFGLDAEGRKEVEAGRWRAVIGVDADGVALTWRQGAKEQRTTPTEVKDDHAEELKAVKAEVSELRRALSVERARLDSMFAEEPRWEWCDWERYYARHPLVGAFARSTIWVFDGVPALGADAPDGADVVELWHPIRSAADEVASWRARLLERELQQPLKQAFREVYLVAPAEEQTRIYSNRFAGHVLRYPQTYALLKERGWSGNALGPWDGGQSATVRREFRTAGLRAEFYLEVVETEAPGLLAELATTDQVRFYPLSERAPEPVPLTEVPAAVFSEAMRDVDLFVGVSSIAADPLWFDRGVERYNDYWYETSFGDLSASAQTRRAVLSEIVPKLTIADRCDVEERFLRVRGDLKTYRIHLGSANILMEPNDQYLCIVPAPTSAQKLRGRLFLPFADDHRLTVILSKAFLLAADTKIRDETILRQIRA